ncbi:hypothetical protein [Flavobacterium sp. XGLA_31]|uniref:hypothetical protein n=1 Tax=Flavobacterium sp. XGLA_31 TaxID=3447666 RepID=UPI003F3B79E2
MSNETYTSTGTLDLKNNTISVTVALPDPPKRSEFELTYYNLSTKTAITGDTLNVILCEFTFTNDPGDELATPTEGTFSITLNLNAVPKPPGLAGVADFDFSVNQNCLFLFFHSTDANADDREAFLENMETLYANAIKGPYVICPAPVLSGKTPFGKPRASGPSIIA